MSQNRFNELIEDIPKRAEELNLNDEKFLFFFEPYIIGQEKFLALCPLKTGVIVFLVIIIIQALSCFLYLFKPGSFLKFIGFLLLLIIFGVSALYICLGFFKKKYSFIKVGYIIISGIFCFFAIIYVLKSITKILKFIIPFSGDFLSFDFIEYVLGYGMFLFGYLYLIYILYLYMVELKKNKVKEKDEDNAENNDIKESV